MRTYGEGTGGLFAWAVRQGAVDAEQVPRLKPTGKLDVLVKEQSRQHSTKQAAMADVARALSPTKAKSKRGQTKVTKPVEVEKEGEDEDDEDADEEEGKEEDGEDKDEAEMEEEEEEPIEPARKKSKRACKK